MPAIQIRVFKARNLYIGEITNLDYNQFVKINDIKLDRTVKEFQTETEPVVDLYMLSSTVLFYVEKLTGNKITPADYNVLVTGRSNYTPYNKEVETRLERLEYKITNIQLKLPEFIYSVGRIHGDILNPLVFFNERSVTQSVIIRTLNKAGFEDIGKSARREPNTYYYYDFEDSFSVYVTLHSGNEIHLTCNVRKASKTVGELIEIESQVEELYLATERMVQIKTSEKDLSFNHIYRILSNLQAIESQLRKVESIQKTRGELRSAEGLVSKMIKDLTSSNIKDLERLNNKIKDEEELRKISSTEVSDA